MQDLAEYSKLNRHPIEFYKHFFLVQLGCISNEILFHFYLAIKTWQLIAGDCYIQNC